MPRNLDLVALRSFVAVAETGGVTKASGFLHLTQSAVSMQIKRLEESLGLSLFERANRKLLLTGAGEQLLGYARRILLLNDEAYTRLTSQELEGEIRLGVPADIVYPAIPQVLQRFHADFPRMRVSLVSSYTRKLKAQFARGEVEVILTTEDMLDAGGETLVDLPLIWVGAPGGRAFNARPLRLAFETNCIFRIGVQSALDAAGITWEMAVDTDSTRTIEATVSADLAVTANLLNTVSPQLERISHNGALPELTSKQINLYAVDSARSEAVEALVQLVREGYARL